MLVKHGEIYLKILLIMHKENAYAMSLTILIKFKLSHQTIKIQNLK